MQAQRASFLTHYPRRLRVGQLVRLTGRTRVGEIVAFTGDLARVRWSVGVYSLCALLEVVK